MKFKKNKKLFSRNIYLTFFILLVLAIAFGIYVLTEKQIDRANEQRLQSFLLADQLRQSSDDLTRMVRHYIVTGDPGYKKFYQDILDIRDGRIPQPKDYFYVYWDLVVADDLPPPAQAGQGVALLDQMKQAGFTERELGELAKAKAHSDRLAELEHKAMELFESAGPNAEDRQIMALQIVFGAGYNAAKAKIMKPINKVYSLVDARTLASVRAAEDNARLVRWLFIAGVVAAVFLLKRSYSSLNAALGGTANEMHAHLQRLARGDLSVPIMISPGMENSVLARLADMQNALHAHEAKLKTNERILRENESRLKALFNTMTAGIIVINEKGNIEDFNHASERLFGYSAAEALGQNINVLMPEPFRTQHNDYLKNYLNNGQKKITENGRELIGKRKDGTTFPLVLLLSEAVQSEHRIFIGFVLDITERKRHEDALKSLQSRLEFLLKSTPAVIYASRPSGDFGATFVSDNITAQLGYQPGDFTTDTGFWLNHIHPEDQQAVKEGLSHILEKDFLKHQYRFLHKDGGYRWMYDECVLIRDKQGHPIELIGYWADITDRKKAEEELRIAAATFETHEAIMITDVNANILRVNQAFEKITGYSATEVVGHNPRILSSKKHDKAFYQEMWNCLLETGIWEGEIWDRRKSGEIYPKWLRITALKDTDSKPTEYVGIFTDITERKKAEQEIHNLAFYDPLTALPNRRLLLNRLDFALSASERGRQYGALLFLDMDKFKLLNDILGHHIGDQMLVEVAERIKFCVREIDTVSRFGGDEFIVLLEDLGDEIQHASQRVAMIAEKIRAALSVPFQFEQHVHSSSTSIGVCLFRGHSVSRDDLIRHADIAMYQAKNAGRNRVQFFDPSLQYSVKARAALESDLREAIRKQQLQLYFQAQYDSDGKAFGAEALLRWTHPERGMIAPSQFIAIAEESTLILDIGKWVLETACKQLADWQKNEAMRHMLVAVNVSAHQFMMDNFVELVKSQIKAHGVAPERLKLELTESVILNEIEEIIHKMQLLKAFGIRLSLDDFGTGYSSLSYLKQLPIDQIKIDQSFVRDIASDPNDAVMVKNIIDIARNFNLNVIAEGVETKEQLEFLRQNGCPAYQGYLFGKPLPIDQFEAHLHDHARRKP